MAAPLPHDEAMRLIALSEYRLLDTVPEESYDDIVRLAAHICGTPIAAVSLIDSHRQWFKAIVGFDKTEVAREFAFCAYTILEEDLMLVPDALGDKRFRDNPLVTENPCIRFYAGAPLVNQGGFALGALCVIDRTPRSLTVEQQISLKMLAHQVVGTMELSKQRTRREDLIAKNTKGEAILRENEARFRISIDAIEEGLALYDADGAIQFYNDSAQRLLGESTNSAKGFTLWDSRWGAVREDGTSFPHEWHPVIVALREGIPQRNVTLGIHKPGGELIWLNVTAIPLMRKADETLTISSQVQSRVQGVVVTFSDITERRRVEDEIRRYAILLEKQRGQLLKLNEELEALATTDGLTGLWNHRSLQARLAEEFEFATQHETTLSLILLDVDAFKQYNDAHGHPTGDAVLKEVADILTKYSRDCDIVARYGGEEFVLILPQTDSAGAAVFAERLRAAVEAFPWPLKHVTASFGVASLRLGEETSADLIARADTALYAAKAAGRNRVVCAPKNVVTIK